MVLQQLERPTRDPELERILQDIKRLRNGISALEDRLLLYLADQRRG